MGTKICHEVNADTDADTDADSNGIRTETNMSLLTFDRDGSIKNLEKGMFYGKESTDVYSIYFQQ